MVPTESDPVPRTIAVEFGTGRELATYPYAMKTLRDRIGEEFYVGQQRHVVVDVDNPDDFNAEGAEIIVTLKRSKP
jgi:hypothetical protein